MNAMTVRALDPFNDWTFGKGIQDYLTYNNAIAQSIQTRLSTFLGECFFNVTVGVDWWNLIGSKDTTLLDLQCQSVILNSFGVTGIASFNLNLNPVTRNFSLTYDVQTIYEGTVAGNVFILTDQQGNVLTDQFGNPLLG